MPERPAVLVPVRVLAGESIPEGVPELLAHAHVVLLGVHVIPEQTAPGQARMQFEERGNRKLDEYEAVFEDAGATVERRLVFTHEAQQTVDRMIYEHDCLAVLVPNATSAPEEVLVPVRGTVGIDRLATVVAGLFGPTDAAVTLYHVVGPEETDEDVTVLLEGLSDRLTEAGLPADRIHTATASPEDTVDAIAAMAEDFDAVVMGETDPSLTTYLFGMPADAVADQFLGPVLVVQRERPDDAETAPE